MKRFAPAGMPASPGVGSNGDPERPRKTVAASAPPPVSSRGQSPLMPISFARRGRVSGV
jgi:hypothetical protein